MCAASQPAIAQLHPALETWQMAAGENRREDLGVCVCVCVCVRARACVSQTETGRMRGRKWERVIPSSVTSELELYKRCIIFAETKLVGADQ